MEKNLRIETIIEKISNDIINYNCTQKEIINITNYLLDLAIKNENNNAAQHSFSYNNFFEKDGVLYTENLEIIPLVKSDFKLIQKWTSEEPGNFFLISRPSMISNNLEEFFSNNSNKIGVIIEKNSKKKIGLMGYLDIDNFQHKAEMRKLIAEPEYKGKGLGKDATKLWLYYGLYTLKLRKIYIYTFDDNSRNIRINEELGFSIEGILKEESFYKNKYYDLIRMSLIKNNENMD